MAKGSSGGKSSGSISSGRVALNAAAARSASAGGGTSSGGTASAAPTVTATQAYNAARAKAPNQVLSYSTWSKSQPAGTTYATESLRAAGNTTRIASPEEIQARNLASSVRGIGGDTAAQAIYKAAGINPNDPNQAPTAVNIAEAERVANEYRNAAATAGTPETYQNKTTNVAEVLPQKTAEEIAFEAANKKITENKPEEAPKPDDVLNKLKENLNKGNIENPFEEGSTAADLYKQMYGILNPLRNTTEDMKKRREEEQKTGKEFIASEAQLKSDILGRNLETGLAKKQAGVEKIRAQARLAEKGVEEGRKKALRYLRGSLAQRGALNTTGTGAFNVSALTSQYDIKNADLQQQANNQVQDMEVKFQDLTTQIQDSQLLTESEKTKLMLELDKQTANAIDALMTNLANQETQISGQAFSLARADDQAAAERKRASAKELRDYLLKRVESGQYVDPNDVSAVVGADPTASKLFSLANKTNRENISKAVSNEYVNMLGADWSTKTNPATGRTYKEGLTDLVVNDISQNHATLDDALAKVRAAIKTSPEYQKLYAAKFAVSGGGGGGFKPTAIKYFKSGGTRGVEFLDSATGQPYYSLNGAAPQPGKLPKNIEDNNMSTIADWTPDTTAAESVLDILNGLNR